MDQSNVGNWLPIFYLVSAIDDPSFTETIRLFGRADGLFRSKYAPDSRTDTHNCQHFDIMLA
jgi:hypothetical protein